jgi:hypothetical protein
LSEKEEDKKDALEEAELVARVLEVRKNDRVEEVLSDLRVGPVFGAVHDDAELVAEELEALLLSEEAVGLETAKEELDTIRHEGVGEILLENAEEDLLVRRAGESLEDHDDGNHVFRLAPRETEGGAAVREVVESVGLGGLVVANGPDLHTVLGVGGATVAEGGTDDGGDVVSSGNDEETDETLVSVDDEITAHLLSFFVVGDKFGGREVTEVTAGGLCREEGEFAFSRRREKGGSAP